MDLTNGGFQVNLIKRFGPEDRPYPMCLVILKKDLTASKINKLSNLFFISIKVSTYKKNGHS